MDLVERYCKLLPKRPAYLGYAFRYVKEENLAVLESLKDPSLAALFAEKMDNEDEDESIDAFAERIAFWEAILTPELQARIKQDRESHEYYGLNSLIVLRVSWIKTLLEMTGREELRGYLSDPQAVSSFERAGRATKLRNLFEPAELETWNSRAEVPIIDSIQSEAAHHVREILEITGLAPTLKQYVKEIEIVFESSIQANGTYSPREKKIRLAGDIESQWRMFLPGILIHELGHALQATLALHRNGQELFDRYAAHIIYSDLFGTSNYAEGHSKTYGRERYIFSSESFAEDLRILLQNPELFTPERRRSVESLFSLILPDVHLEELRSKIRQMYGLLYGVGVSNVHRTPDCHGIARVARMLDRSDSEDRRDRKKKTEDAPPARS